MCQTYQKKNSSFMNLFAIIVLALLHLPKKQLSEISFKNNL